MDDGVARAAAEGQGAVSVAGIDLSALPTEARKLGLMQQDDVLFPHLTVLENLLFGLPRDRSAASSRSDPRDLALRALEQVRMRVPVLLVTHDPQDVREDAPVLRLRETPAPQSRDHVIRAPGAPSSTTDDGSA